MQEKVKAKKVLTVEKSSYISRMNMRYIDGEMTFSPGTSAEEVKLHCEIARCKAAISMMGLRKSDPIARANIAAERDKIRELRGKLDNLSKRKAS
jgi:hypothetical protein